MRRLYCALLLLSWLGVGYGQNESAPVFHPELVFGVKARTTTPPSLLTDEQRVDLRNFAKECLLKVEEAATKEDPYWKARWQVRLAVAWMPLDAARAKSLLEAVQAKQPETPTHAYPLIMAIADAWCDLDLERAVQLNKSLERESYVAGKLAHFDLNRAAAMLHGEEDTLNAAYDVMRSDPDLAIKLIEAVPGVDHEKLISYIVANLVTQSLDDNEHLVSRVTDQQHREALLASMVRELGTEYPDRALATAMSLRLPDHRAEAMARLARLFARTNPAVGRYAAHEALAAYAKASEEDRDRLANYWSFVWEVAGVDMPEVRTFLESKHGVPLLHLAAAWAQIDQDRADSLVEEVSQISTRGDAKMIAASYGASPSDEYVHYLIGTARRNPERAAALLLQLVSEVDLKNQDPESGWPGTSSGLWVHEAAREIRDELSFDCPRQAAAFLQALGDKWLLKAEPGRAAARRLKNDPAALAQAMPLLDDGEWNEIKPVLIPAVQKALGELVFKRKTREALALASKAPTTRMRAFLYSVIASRLTEVAPREVLPVLRDAARDIAKEHDNNVALDALIELADHALEMAKGD